MRKYGNLQRTYFANIRLGLKMMRVFATVTILVMSILSGLASAEGLLDGRVNSLLIGEAAFGDWKSDSPGLRRHISASELPAPYTTRSAENGVMVVKQPDDARLKAPTGFKVKRFASGLDQPRLIRVAPNGDIFIAESGAGRIRVLRPSANGEEASRNEIFASGLRLPFGIAFFPNGNDPQWVYVANTDSVVRFRYRNGDLQASSKPEVVVPSLPQGGNHWTRDIAFSLDNTKMFVSVGSASNDGELTGTLSLKIRVNGWLSCVSG